MSFKLRIQVDTVLLKDVATLDCSLRWESNLTPLSWRFWLRLQHLGPATCTNPAFELWIQKRSVISIRMSEWCGSPPSYQTFPHALEQIRLLLGLQLSTLPTWFTMPSSPALSWTATKINMLHSQGENVLLCCCRPTGFTLHKCTLNCLVQVFPLHTRGW